MKRRGLVLVAGSVTLAVAAMVLVGTMGNTPRASADGGPHGGYTATSGPGGTLPDHCAACHRVHQGQSVGKLLKASSPYALCLTCHNGSGSVLDVMDGIRLGATIAPAVGTIRRGESGDLTASVAPVADVSIPAGEVAEYTLAIRNAGVGGSATVAIAAAAGDTLAFGAATLTTQADQTPAASKIITLAAAPSVTYVNVAVPSLGTAVAGNTITLPINVTLGGSTPQVVLSARVRAAADNYVAGNPVLNGGGFMFVAGQAVTSRHNADPADNSLNPWGFNANTGQNVNALTGPLQCTSCHNPHGTSNYRILKEGINGNVVNVQAFSGGVFTKQEGARGLEAGAPADKYTSEYYGSDGLGGAGNPGIGSLCGACHTAYPSQGASAALVAGGVTHFRHKTEMPFTDWNNPDTGRVSTNPETAPTAGFPALRLASNSGTDNEIVQCLTCHRVHGNSTTMDGYALQGGVGADPAAAAQLDALFGVGVWNALGDDDLTPSQTLDVNGQLSLSSLLFTDNRGMCQACHQWGVTP